MRHAGSRGLRRTSSLGSPQGRAAGGGSSFCPPQGTGPKLGGSPGAAPSVSEAAYNTPGEAIWDQTGLGGNQLLPVTGLLGFQPNLGTAAVSPPPPRSQPRLSISPPRFTLGLELQLVQTGVALPQAGTALGCAGKRCQGAMATAAPVPQPQLRPPTVTPTGDTASTTPPPTPPAPQPGARHHWDAAGRARRCWRQLGESKPRFTAVLGRRA